LGVSLHGGSKKVQPMRLHQLSAARRRLSRLEPPSRRRREPSQRRARATHCPFTSPTVKFLILRKQKTDPPQILKFSKTETRISID
jgi:hypothetical protein